MVSDKSSASGGVSGPYEFPYSRSLLGRELHELIERSGPSPVRKLEPAERGIAERYNDCKRISPPRTCCVPRLGEFVDLNAFVD